MNATLLKSSNAQDDPVKRELFGSFKGFSLKPLPMSKPNIMGAANVAYVHPVAKAESTIQTEHCVPSRMAPLPPPSVVSATANSPKKLQFKSSPKSSPSSTYRYQNINATSEPSPETPIEVKLFAAKSDTKERPKISNPVLENSTVSVKEFIATANAAQPKTHGVLKSTVEKGAINKNAMKKLDISAPIKTVTFGRSQSMRSPSSEKAPAMKRNVLASGSMRYPPGKRPGHITVDRPKNPPPPRPTNPPAGTSHAPLRNIYANTNGGDDGSLSNANSTDNIYCVIEDVAEETPPQNGLLSEIVNEIGNRNVDSIYSTSKNQRKNAAAPIEPTAYENVGAIKNTEKFSAQNDSFYMNTADIVAEPISKQSENETSKSNNVSSLAKKLAATSTAFGSGAAAKPTIATKPQTVSNSVHAKSLSTSNKEAAQTDSTKKPYTRPVYATAVGKPRTTAKTNAPGKANINPTSTVRQMHKRFENRNA